MVKAWTHHHPVFGYGFMVSAANRGRFHLRLWPGTFRVLVRPSSGTFGLEKQTVIVRADRTATVTFRILDRGCACY